MSQTQARVLLQPPAQPPAGRASPRPLLLRNWCPVLGVKVKGHENSEHLTQWHV